MIQKELFPRVHSNGKFDTYTYVDNASHWLLFTCEKIEREPKRASFSIILSPPIVDVLKAFKWEKNTRNGNDFGD